MIPVWSQTKPEINLEIKRTEDFAFNLAKAAKTLLEEVKKDEPSSHRLEVRFIKEKATLTVVVDPIYWFEDYLPKQKGVDRFLLARNWIATIDNSVKRTGLRFPHFDLENNQQILVWPREYCKHAIDCDYALKNGCNLSHSTYSCVGMTKKLNKKEDKCGWYYHEEMAIDTLNKAHPLWLISCRAGSMDFSRELLLFPRPLPWTTEFGGSGKPHVPYQLHLDNNSSQWNGHYINHNLAAMPFFWETILKIEADLMLECGKEFQTMEYIALNFGRWESKLAQDWFSLECHGHAHIVLTSQCQIILSEKANFAPLSGRYADPPLYCLNDVEQLRGKSSFHTMNQIEKKLDHTDERIAKIEKKLDHTDDRITKIEQELVKHGKQLDTLVRILLTKFPDPQTRVQGDVEQPE